MNHGLSQAFELLLDFLKRNRGFDFTGYKRASLIRRVNKRMLSIDIEQYSDYQDYLELHPEEYNQLFNGILINVTSFFRDPEAWETLKKEIIPRILASHSPQMPIRIWSAGCASGEEAYSLAILLSEAIGVEEFHERVKIYATDMDEDALAHARAAVYGEDELQNVPAEYRDKYFDHQGSHYVFRKELRRTVIFGQHDLAQDAPISRIDLLVCRNLLMYFNAETQSKILTRLHFALNDNGYLFLGRAEMLMTHSDLFAPIDLKCRIFTKVPKMNLRERLLVMAQNGGENNNSNRASTAPIRELTFDSNPMAQIVLDTAGNMAMANERARAMFGLTNRDVGRPFQDLQVSYRPVDLRTSIDKVISNRETIVMSDIPWNSPSGEDRMLEVYVVPLLYEKSGPQAVNMIFVDTTRQKLLQERVEHTNQELETALEELQSTIEELETTNEELQSTNEELETMNEELQSTNEELETMNEEMRVRTDELNQVNAFIEAILTSFQGGVIVLDNEMRIQVWNKRSEDLWGLRTEELEGTHFFSLDSGLPVEQLKKPIRAALGGEPGLSDVVIAATNRRGRAIQCRVSFTPLFTPDRAVHGVILIVQEVEESS